MPPPLLAEVFPLMVLLIMLTVPLELETPPPPPADKLAELPLMVLLVTLTVPARLLLKMPPAALLPAALPLITQLLTFTVPSLFVRRPAPAVLPPEMVSPLKVTLMLPLETVKMRKSGGPPPVLRCTVRRAAPGPLMLTLPVIVGKAPFAPSSRIVLPLSEGSKLIVSSVGELLAS